MRVLHVIMGLDTGGAESMLLKLIRTLEQRGIENFVVSLTPAGGLFAETHGVLGDRLRVIDFRGARAVRGLAQLALHVRRVRADVLQGWMPHGNFAAAITSAACRHSALVLSIRQALYDLRHESPNTRRLIRLNALLSARADAIVYNSTIAAQQHEQLGYPKRLTSLIPNGFDLGRFRPDDDRRAHFRQSIGATDQQVVLGMVGRYHPMKDHATFLAAAAIARRANPLLRFVLAGRGVDAANGPLRQQVADMGVTEVTHLLGEHGRPEELFCGFDIATLTSYTEAFPNVIGEAMACGVPCVSTDVGDTRAIIADTGMIVAPRDPAALASAWLQLAALNRTDRRLLGLRARERIEGRWSIDAVGTQYEALYASLVATQHRARQSVSL